MHLFYLQPLDIVEGRLGYHWLTDGPGLTHVMLMVLLLRTILVLILSDCAWTGWTLHKISTKNNKKKHFCM